MRTRKVLQNGAVKQGQWERVPVVKGYQNGDEEAYEIPPNQYSGPLRIDCCAAFARGMFSRG